MTSAPPRVPAASPAALVALALAACGGSAPARDHPPHNAGPAAPIDAAPPGPWATRCRDALIVARDAAAAIEPKLATMPAEVETRADREEVHAGAYPPTWDVAPIHVFATRPASSAAADAAWHTFANFELGGDHRTARRVDGTVDVSILMDGWDPAVADAVIAAMEPRLEPCFAP